MNKDPNSYSDEEIIGKVLYYKALAEKRWLTIPWITTNSQNEVRTTLTENDLLQQKLIQDIQWVIDDFPNLRISLNNNQNIEIRWNNISVCEKQSGNWDEYITHTLLKISIQKGEVTMMKNYKTIKNLPLIQKEWTKLKDQINTYFQNNS